MSEASKTVSLGDFPMHILVQILSMCPADAAVRVCCTCAQLHLLSTDTELWGLQAAQLQRLHSRLAPIAAAASARRNRLCADWGIESDAVADAADACAAAQTLWKHGTFGTVFSGGLTKRLSQHLCIEWTRFLE